MGSWLHTTAEGKGYMTQAVQLLTDDADHHLHANRIMLCLDERNTRSIALAERLHFRQEGRLRHQEIAADGTLPTMRIFALTPQDRLPSDPSHD